MAASVIDGIPYGHRMLRERPSYVTSGALLLAKRGRSLQGVPQAVPDVPAGYISRLEGGSPTSALGVAGGSDIFIGGQFGDVSYVPACCHFPLT